VQIVVANIIADVIIDIAPIVPSYLETGGLLLTSGIIKERRQEVIDCYTGLGFTCEKTVEIGEWVAIVFRCQGSL
jgi:ribosomal protein L11 methyltransferase